MHQMEDDNGTYLCSNPILVWDNDEDTPLGVGVYEDGKYYINGVATYTATHWAYINKPDGHILQD